MAWPDHPNKHIREAIKYAESKGWTKRPGGAHAKWVMYCPCGQRGGCHRSVWSTPRIPEIHAREITEAVDDCPHCKAIDEE